MSDDVTVDNGDLTDFVVATDDVGSKHYQYVKVVYGGDGTATKVEEAAPLPVSATTELDTMDMDTGGGTDTQAVVGIVVEASGGAVLVPGDATNGLKVQVATVPAASRASDSVSAALAVDKLMSNLTAVTPVHVAIDAASSGDNTLVAAQGTSNIILVHQVFLVASAAVTVRFESGAAGTALTGQIQLAANQGFVLPFSPVGWFKTAANTLLNLELSGATSVDGSLAYTVVT
jgi:hypothetical protein